MTVSASELLRLSLFGGEDQAALWLAKRSWEVTLGNVKEFADFAGDLVMTGLNLFWGSGIGVNGSLEKFLAGRYFGRAL